MMNTAILKASWLELLQHLEVDLQLKEEIFNNLVNAYGDSARHYHNLRHINDILDSFKAIASSNHNSLVLQFAAWFHDYIYDPQAKDNEVKSAICAEEILKKLGIEGEIIQPVTQIILSTQKHQPLIDSIDNLFFLDADLAILGSSPSRYSEYARAIRKEYQHLSDRDYFSGRQLILTGFLQRNRIYYSDLFYRRLERQARINLTAEIDLLN